MGVADADGTTDADSTAEADRGDSVAEALEMEVTIELAVGETTELAPGGVIELAPGGVMELVTGGAIEFEAGGIWLGMLLAATFEDDRLGVVVAFGELVVGAATLVVSGAAALLLVCGAATLVVAGTTAFVVFLGAAATFPRLVLLGGAGAGAGTAAFLATTTHVLSAFLWIVPPFCTSQQTAGEIAEWLR